MASDQVVVRYATREDVPTILGLIQELALYERLSDEVQATEESLLATLSFAPPTASTASIPRAGTAHTLLLFAPDGVCSGMALYFYSYSTWRAAPGIYLEDLFIKEAYRKRGYGKRLLAELAAEVKRINGKRLEWSVLKWNSLGIGFYESLGAKAQNEWFTMRVADEALDTLASQVQSK
ncbi:MAG: hypothetical protein M1829_000792 [Trizodia sp. TS-e1964]|nr:MAG: hypothetical protein M1829_000792 [Trizodia sp. TS-e1964]